jgi:hypothetical protein
MYIEMYTHSLVLRGRNMLPGGGYSTAVSISAARDLFIQFVQPRGGQAQLGGNMPIPRLQVVHNQLRLDA